VEVLDALEKMARFLHANTGDWEETEQNYLFRTDAQVAQFNRLQAELFQVVERQERIKRTMREKSRANLLAVAADLRGQSR
jgi:hypothetical protein